MRRGCEEAGDSLWVVVRAQAELFVYIVREEEDEILEINDVDADVCVRNGEAAVEVLGLAADAAKAELPLADLSIIFAVFRGFYRTGRSLGYQLSLREV